MEGHAVVPSVCSAASQTMEKIKQILHPRLRSGTTGDRPRPRSPAAAAASVPDVPLSVDSDRLRNTQPPRQAAQQQTAQPPQMASSSPALSRPQVQVVVHRVQNVGVLPGQRLFWLLKLRGVDGSVVQKQRSTSHGATGNRTDWDEAFVFTPDFEGQLLELRLMVRGLLCVRARGPP